MKPKGHRILFVPSLTEGRGMEGQTILDAARAAGVYIEASCNGKGLCGRCAVRIMEGRASTPTDAESALLHPADMRLGGRLACMARITGPLTVLTPQESFLPKGVKPFTGELGAVNPAVKGYRLDLSEGDAAEARFEHVRGLMALRHGMDGLRAGVAVLRDLGRPGRDLEGPVTVLVREGREIVGVLPGHDARYLGLALDIGTTTIAAYVGDLRDGRLLATGAATNPQVLFGSDIMSRISYASAHPEGTAAMQTGLAASINALLRHMAEGGAFELGEIVDATVVGNTVMHHLFLGIAPDRLGLMPFTPAIRGSLDAGAGELGLQLGEAVRVHVLPLIGGFVGADTVAVLLSSAPHRLKEPALVIDIGTNGEIVLGNAERLLCCSCATGPAFEGARITCGMRAIEGAISRVRLDPGTFEVDYTVVGRDGWAHAVKDALRPAGLCGSGVIDALAQLYRAGVINADGAFSRATRTPRLRTGKSGMREFVLAAEGETATGRDIVLTQRDIREVQLAKAALYAGCRVLMGRMNISEIRKVVIAGAFGMHLDKESALTLGLLPPVAPESIAMVGNAAGHGAYLALMDTQKRREADELAGRVIHVELASEETFQRQFMDGLAMPRKEP